jgi:hypothetical protein
MDVARRTLTFISQNSPSAFALSLLIGAGFELFKIKFSPNGVNYYGVFKRNQLKRELERLEFDLISTERIIRENLGTD